jgi:hypothetical protein
MIFLYIKDLNFSEKLTIGMLKELEEHIKYITKILARTKVNVLEC